jgi:hypothetical protein
MEPRKCAQAFDAGIIGVQEFKELQKFRSLLTHCRDNIAAAGPAGLFS